MASDRSQRMDPSLVRHHLHVLLLVPHPNQELDAHLHNQDGIVIQADHPNTSPATLGLVGRAYLLWVIHGELVVLERAVLVPRGHQLAAGHLDAVPPGEVLRLVRRLPPHSLHAKLLLLQGFHILLCPKQKDIISNE